MQNNCLKYCFFFVEKMDSFSFIYAYRLYFNLTMKLTTSSVPSQTCAFMSSCFCSYREQLLDVRCRTKAIPQFPMSTNINSLVILLDYTDILQNRSFTNLTHLRKLDLSGSNLKYIEADAFFGLEKLQSLSLRGNQLS